MSPSRLTFQRLSGEGIRSKRQQLVAFLHEHLGDFGDPTDQISACLDFVLHPAKGGAVFTATSGGQLAGAVVLNRTGMGGYIPENILVYIAVDAAHRGQGIGAQLMNEALAGVDGAVALHVEPHNPARRLYERLGFENKYLEMRYIRPNPS